MYWREDHCIHTAFKSRFYVVRSNIDIDIEHRVFLVAKHRTSRCRFFSNIAHVYNFISCYLCRYKSKFSLLYCQSFNPSSAMKRLKKRSLNYRWRIFFLHLQKLLCKFCCVVLIIRCSSDCFEEANASFLHVQITLLPQSSKSHDERELTGVAFLKPSRLLKRALITLSALRYRGPRLLQTPLNPDIAVFRTRRAEPTWPTTRYTKLRLMQTSLCIPDKNALINMSILSGDLCMSKLKVPIAITQSLNMTSH